MPVSKKELFHELINNCYSYYEREYDYVSEEMKQELNELEEILTTSKLEWENFKNLIRSNITTNEGHEFVVIISHGMNSFNVSKLLTFAEIPLFVSIYDRQNAQRMGMYAVSFGDIVNTLNIPEDKINNFISDCDIELIRLKKTNDDYKKTIGYKEIKPEIVIEESVEDLSNTGIRKLIISLLCKTSTCDTHLIGQLAEDFSKSNDWKVEYDDIKGYYDGSEFKPFPQLSLSVRLSNYLLEGPLFNLSITPSFDSDNEISTKNINYWVELYSEEQRQDIATTEITYQELENLNIKEETLLEFREAVFKILEIYVKTINNKSDDIIEESVEEFVNKNTPTLDNCWDFSKELVANWENKEEVVDARKLKLTSPESIKKLENIFLKYFPKEIVDIVCSDIEEKSSRGALPICSYLEHLILLTDIRNPDELKIIEDYNDRLQPVIQIIKQTTDLYLIGEIFFGNNTDLYTNDFTPDLQNERFILNVHENQGYADVFGQVLDNRTLVNVFKIPEDLLLELLETTLKSGNHIDNDIIEEAEEKEYKQLKKVSDNPVIQKLYTMTMNQYYGQGKKKDIEGFYAKKFQKIDNNNNKWKFITTTDSAKTLANARVGSANGTLTEYSILQLIYDESVTNDHDVIEIEPAYKNYEKKNRKQITEIDFVVRIGKFNYGYNDFYITYQELLQLNIPNDVLTQFLQSVNDEINEKIKEYYSSKSIADRNELNKRWNDPLEVDPNEVIEEAEEKPLVRDNEQIWEHLKNNDMFYNNSSQDVKNLQYDVIEAIRNSDDMFVGYVDENGNPITEDNKPRFEEDMYSAIVVKIKLNKRPKKVIIEFNPIYDTFSYTVEPSRVNLGMFNITITMLEDIYNIPEEFILDCINLGHNSKRYEYYRLDKRDSNDIPLEEAEELPSMKDITKELESWDETKEEDALLDKVGELLPTAQYRLGKYCIPEKCKAIIEMVSHPENWKLERANSSVPYFKYIVKDIEHVEYFDLTFDRNNEDVISNVYLPYTLSLHYNPEQYFGITDVIFHSLTFSDLLNLLHLPLEVVRQVQEKNIEYTSQYRDYLTKSDREVIEESKKSGLNVDKIKNDLLKSLTNYSVNDENIIEPLKNNLISLTGNNYDSKIVDIAIRYVKEHNYFSKSGLIDELFKAISLLNAVRDTKEEKFIKDLIYLPSINTNIVSIYDSPDFQAVITNTKEVLFIKVDREELLNVLNISPENVGLLALAQLEREHKKSSSSVLKDIIEESVSAEDIEKRKQEIINFSDEELEDDILEDDRRARAEQIYEIRNGQKEIVDKVVDSGISVEFENGNDDIGYSALISLSFNNNSFGKWEVSVNDCYYGNFYEYYSTDDLVNVFGISIDLINEYRETIDAVEKIDQSNLAWQSRINQENIIEESVEPNNNARYNEIIGLGNESLEKLEAELKELEIKNDDAPDYNDKKAWREWENSCDLECKLATKICSIKARIKQIEEIRNADSFNLLERGIEIEFKNQNIKIGKNNIGYSAYISARKDYQKIVYFLLEINGCDKGDFKFQEFSTSDLINVFGVKEEMLEAYFNTKYFKDLSSSFGKINYYEDDDEIIEESVEESNNNDIEDFIDTKLGWLANDSEDDEATKANHKYLIDVINFYRKQLSEGNYKLGYFGKHWGEIVSDRTDYADVRYMLVIEGNSPLDTPRYEKGLIYYDYVKKQFLVSLNGHYNLDGGYHNWISPGDIIRIFDLPENIITRIIDYNEKLAEDERADKPYIRKEDRRIDDIEE